MTIDQLLAELEVQLAARRERKMGDYKLVPVELTTEMMEEGLSGWNGNDLSETDLDDMWRRMLAAAPAVQGEPVVFRFRTSESAMWNYVDWRGPDEIEKDNFEIQYLSATPQPAEQQPAPHTDDAAVDRFAVAMKDKLAASREKGRYGWQSATAPYLSALLYDHMYKADPLDVGNLAMMLHQNGQAIELPHEVRKTDAQPAPDVAGLVGALESALGSFDDWCEGQDPSDIADAIDAFPWVMQARAALSAHRKQETSHDNQ